jgi:single-strand DNA-binding protein
MSLNQLLMIGNLGQDPEIRYTPSGLPLVNFATDEPYADKDGKRQERVEWHRIVVIGKLALSCNEYLKKGRQGVCRESAAHPRIRCQGRRSQAVPH